MSSIRDAAMNAKAWPFDVARKLLKRAEKSAGQKGYVLLETGYGPSGLPHIGTFGEVSRTTMVRHAFDILSDIPTKLISFSDDLDGMRKIPDNVPDPEGMAAYLQCPLTSVPGVKGAGLSYGDENNAKLREFLDHFGFEYEFISATEFYRAGKMDDTLLLACERYDAIMNVMLPSLRAERRETYSPFLPISPKTGRVLYVPMLDVNASEGIITYRDEDGEDITISVTGGNVKFQWKPDFGARWAALGVDFEMFGKDHSTNAPIYGDICEILGGKRPENFVYELFLDEGGEKISKTKGNGLTIDDWLTYASPESLTYFMYQKPQTAKRLHLDVIPKAVDEYHQQLQAYHNQEIAQQLANPVYHIHGGKVPTSTMVVPFAMLLNLVSVSGATEKERLWGFIQRYAPDATPERNPDLDRAAGYAIRYFEDFVAPGRVFRLPSEKEAAALRDLSARFAEHIGETDPETLQSVVFAVGREHGFDPLRDWFKALYETLLGASQGPRFGGFAALYGVMETRQLIGRALDGELVAL